MKKIFHTPEGIIERELTQEEIIYFAELGDEEARLELYKQEYAAAASPGSLQEKIDIIAKYLGLTE